MNNRKIIGFDLDDTVWDFNRPFVSYMNNTNGTNVAYADITSFVFQEIYSLPLEEMKVHFSKFCRHHHDTVPLNPGVKAAISGLFKEHSLIGITARSEKVAELTHKHINYLGIGEVFNDIYFTDERSKVDICRKNGVCLLFEDALHNAKEVAAAGIPVIMPNRPWNQEETPTGVIRVNGWKQAYTEALKILN